MSMLYPVNILVTGDPLHGLADLQLVIDTNDVTDTRIVLTADLLVSLHRQIGAKLKDIHLVGEEP